MRLFKGRHLAAYVTAILFFVLGTLHMALADEPISKYTRQTGAETVLVFVHGILGDGVSSWTNSETNSYWPAMLALDHTFDGVDIFVYSYDTGLLASLSIDE